MTTFRFSAKVSREGTIKIPNGTELSDKEVEVVISPKVDTRENNPEKYDAIDFLEEWSGVLKGKLDNDSTDENIMKIKYDYLMEKHK